MRISGKNVIGHEVSEAFSDAFKTFNPALNCENDFDIFSVTNEDLESAVQKAASCFTEFSNLPGKKRADFLLRIAQNLSDNKEILIQHYCLESGLGENRAVLELKRTIHQLHEFSDLISSENWNFSSKEEADPNRVPSPKPSLDKYFKALGPVVVFGAGNFPFAYSTIGGDTSSALAAGCPVIVKSHAMHAGTGDLVAQLVSKAAKESGMPDGVFSNLNSRGIEAGQKLVLHPFIKAVGFTGSFQGGMALYRLAQSRKEPIPVFAEMGSVNPVLIFESAFTNDPKLHQKIAQSISLSAGQFCTNPGLIFLIKSKLSDSFCDQLVVDLNKVEEQVMLHPQIHKNYLKNASLVEVQKGIVNLVQTKKAQANKIRPILRKITFSDFVENELLQEEVFGSHTLIVELEKQSQFEEIIQKIQGQLTISIFSFGDELKTSLNLLHLCEQQAGRIIFNGVPTGVEVCEAMHHGGPFPATTDSRFTAVGKDAVYRFLRPVTYQNVPGEILKLLIN